MKCMMFDAEDASDLIVAESAIFNRAYPTDHRGDIFIGCKATEVSNPFLCAVAALDDVTFDAEENIYEWHLSNIRNIKPLPVKAQLRLFECGQDEFEVIDGESEEAVNAAYDEADSWIAKRKKAR